jgi:hypothetical protein
MSNVEMKDFVCEQCDLEFTREKDYFEGREEHSHNSNNVLLCPRSNLSLL